MTTFQTKLASFLKVALPIVVATFFGLLYVQSQITFPNGAEEAGLLTMFGTTIDISQEAFKAINVITGTISLPTLYWGLGIVKQLSSNHEKVQRQEQLAVTNQVNMSVIDQQQKNNAIGISLLGEIVLEGLEANPALMATKSNVVDTLRAKFNDYTKETNRLANIYVSADSVPNDKRMEITRDILDSLIGIVKQGSVIGNQEIVQGVTQLANKISQPATVTRNKKKA